MPDLNTFFKNVRQKLKYYTEQKQDFERLSIFLNMKMSVKSTKIELSEQFMAMWTEEQTFGGTCPHCIETKMKKTKV